MQYDPLGDGLSDLSLIDHMGDDSSIVRAARVSYSGDDRTGVDLEGDAKLLRYLLRHGHTSPLEHTAVTFHVKCPLFVRSQWHRHRIASYNEVSRRYTSEEIEFYYPTELRMQDVKNRQGSVGTWIGEEDYHWYMRDCVKNCLELYEKMLADGIAREQARMFLPQNLYTRFYYTANLHSILHFYRLRADEHAQWEIRQYAQAIGDIMGQLFPVTWSAATQEKGAEG